MLFIKKYVWPFPFLKKSFFSRFFLFSEQDAHLWIYRIFYKFSIPYLINVSR